MPDIDIFDRPARLQFTASVGQTIFNLNFIIFSEDDIDVIVDGVSKTLTTDYTISGVEDEDGFTLTFNSPLSGGELVTIARSTTIERFSKYQNDGVFDAEPLERDLDKITTILQELRRDLDRTLTLDIDSPINSISLPTAQADRVLIWNGTGDALINGPTADNIDSAQGYADDAEAAQIAAEAARDKAELWAEEDEDVAVESGRFSSKHYSLKSEGFSTDAQDAATAAQQALESMNYPDVVNIVFADSPVTVDADNVRNFFSVDTSGGNIVFNLDPNLTEPFSCRIKKETADTNTVTVNTQATETFFDGSTSKVISSIGGLDLQLDTSTSPDTWKSVAFGAVAGEPKKQQFTRTNGDFTTGTTSLTLTNTPLPASSSGLYMNIDTHDQHSDAFTYDPDTGIVTFDALGANVESIEFKWGSGSLTIGVTADGTVSWNKFASSVIGSLSDIIAGATQKFARCVDVLNFVQQYGQRNSGDWVDTETTPATSFNVGDADSIPNDVDRVYLVLDGVGMSGNEDLVVQLADTNGTVTSGYSGSNVRISGNSVAEEDYSDGFHFYLGGGGVRVVNCIAKLERISGNKWEFTYMNFDDDGLLYFHHGFVTLTDNFSHFVLTSEGSNNIDSGQARVKWEY